MPSRSLRRFDGCKELALPPPSKLENTHTSLNNKNSNNTKSIDRSFGLGVTRNPGYSSSLGLGVNASSSGSSNVQEGFDYTMLMQPTVKIFS